MRCPACQTSIADDSRFCAYCGAAVKSAPTADAATRAAGAGGPVPSAAAALAGGSSGPPDPHTEQPVMQFRPAWRAYWGAWLIWLLGSLVVLYLLGKLQLDSWWWRAGLGLIAGTALVVLGRQAWQIYGVRYRLTTQRLFIDRGLLARTGDQMELLRIDDVRTRQRAIDRLLDIGSVQIISTDATDKECVLTGVARPADIAEAIRRHTRLLRARQTLFVENI
jgi:membrane protein YdbS with pleckstrin-like domain